MNNEATMAARPSVLATDVRSVAEPRVVSWPAIIAGAIAAAALSLILLILGTGLGLSSVSPWADQGASASTFGWSTILWVTLTQVAAAGMGGYLAGRLRSRWAGTDIDEVYFRDTAHGFLAWALATLLTAALLTATIGSILGGGVKVASAAAGAAGTAALAAAPAMGEAMKSGSVTNPSQYFVDSLFRKDAASSVPGATSNDSMTSATEVTRIFVNAMASGSLAADDAKYVSQLVSQRTGLSPADAEKRVNDTFARVQAKAKELDAAARDAADKARKASAYAALWLFVSLLVGAFCASWTATFGGRRRDQF